MGSLSNTDAMISKCRNCLVPEDQYGKRKTFLGEKYYHSYPNVNYQKDEVSTLLRREIVKSYKEFFLDMDYNNMMNGEFDLRGVILDTDEQCDDGEDKLSDTMKSIHRQLRSLKLELNEKTFFLNSILLSRSKVVKDMINENNARIEEIFEAVFDEPEVDVVDDLIRMNRQPEDNESFMHDKDANYSTDEMDSAVIDLKEWPKETVLLVGDSILNEIEQRNLSRRYTVKKATM